MQKEGWIQLHGQHMGDRLKTIDSMNPWPLKKIYNGVQRVFKRRALLTINLLQTALQRQREASHLI